MKSHLDDNISLDEISEEIGLNKSYMCRVFKEISGYSIVTYFNIVRMHKAINMIDDNISITEVATKLGFYDYNYFSRCFKKAIGFSPTQYIEKIKK